MGQLRRIRRWFPIDPLQRYLTEIRRFHVLNREDEHRLAVEYKEFGNVKAAYNWSPRISAWSL